MRKSINRIGGLLILFVMICLLWGAIANHVHETFNSRRLVIIKNCEYALPILTRRYQVLIPFLETCEKQEAWSNNFEFFVYARPAFPSADPNYIPPEDTEDFHHDIMRFTGIKDDLNASTSQLVIVDFTALHDGVARFRTGTTAFEKVMGATEIEPNLSQIITAATNLEIINARELLGKLRADLAATDSDASAAISNVSNAVAEYNSAVAHSSLARFLQITPISVDSKLVTWEEGHHSY